MRRKISSIFLTLAMVFTLMPTFAFADTPVESKTGTYVTDVSFNLVGGTDRFVFYDGIDNEMGSYYYSWQNGDQATVTRSDESVKNITFVAEGQKYGWYDGDQMATEAPFFKMQDTSGWTVGNSYPIYANCGFDSQGQPFEVEVGTATIESSPVTALTFTPSATSALSRFTATAGEYYEPEFIAGDQVSVTIKGTSKTYTYDSNSGEFKNGTETLPTRYGYIYFDDVDSTTWETGNQTIKVVYGGQTWDAYDVTVTASPIKRMVFAPFKKDYTEAEVRLIENKYETSVPSETPGQFITTTHYNYNFTFQDGDNLAITWADDSASVYTFKKGAFVNPKGETLPDEIANPIYDGEDTDRIEVPDGETTSTFAIYVEYKGKKSLVNLTLKKSSDAEKEVAESKSSALNEVARTMDDIDYSKYRQAQQTELADIETAAIKAINDATSTTAVDSALAKFRTDVAAVKTDEQMTKDEEEAKKKEEVKPSPTVQPTQPIVDTEWVGILGNIPKAKSVKAKAGKKKAIVSWKKPKKKTLKKYSKVEVQICTDRNFARENTKRFEVKKSKKSKTIKGLKKKTTYYVRVRNVKGSGTSKIVSNWSKVKKVKIKK